ncbi:hypothetical protein PQQ96_02545 [Paraburkholderia sediminicola]|uniref:hypothetical protein n=1 Tax=Paraburkholderia sediminicola TaxID=458836 RepID=UPI0038BB7B73
MHTLLTQPRWLLRTLRITIPTTVGCAWLYSTIYRESFAEDLVYAFFVVSFTQALVAAERHGRVYWLRKRFPESFDAEGNWPGWLLAVCMQIYSGECKAHALLRGCRKKWNKQPRDVFAPT